MMGVSVQRPYVDALFDLGARVFSKDVSIDHRGELAIRVGQRADTSFRGQQARNRRLLAEGETWHPRAAGTLAGIVDLTDIHAAGDCALDGACAVYTDGFSWARMDAGGSPLFHWVVDNPRDLADHVVLAAPGRHVFALHPEVATSIRAYLSTLTA